MNPDKKTSRILLLIILGLGLATRCFDLTGLGLWQDERMAVTGAHGLILTDALEIEQQPFSAEVYIAEDTYANTRKALIIEEGGNTVVYQTLMRAWSHTFGTRDFNLRMLNILIGLATIFLLFLFTERLTGSRNWALLAAALAAFHPLLIQYSVELRSYNLAGFMTLLGSYLFVLRWVKPDSGQSEQKKYMLAGLYFLVVLLTLLTHYLTLLLFAAHGVWMLFFSRNWKDWLMYGTAMVSVGIGFYIWLVPLKGNEGFEYIERRNQKWKNLVEFYRDKENDMGIRPATPVNVAMGVGQSITSMGGVGFQGRGWRIRNFLPLLAIPILLVMLGLWKGHEDKKVRWFLIFLVCGMPASYVLMAFRAGHTISFNPTYNMFNTAFWVVGMALAIPAIKHLKNHILRTGVLALFLLQFAMMFVSAHPRNSHFMKGPNPYTAAVDAVLEKYQPGDTVVWPDWYVSQMCNLYLRSRTDIPQRVSGASTQAVLLRHADGREEVVAKVWDPWHKLPEQ